MRIAAIASGFMVTAIAGLVLAALPLNQAAGAVPPHPQLRSITMIGRLPRPTPAATQLQNWIHALANGNTSAQSRARRLLIAAGKAAVPALKNALHQNPTIQVHQRLQAALDALYIRDALRAPLVSVRARNASVKTIIGVLCDQVGMYPYFPSKPAWKAQRLNINVQRQPFWKVLLRIAKITGVGPTGAQYGPAAGFFFDRPGLFSHASAVSIHGNIALVIQSAWQKTIYGSQQTSGQGHRELVIKYCGLYVPTPHVLLQTSPLEVRLAVDDQHRILALPTPNRYLIYDFDNSNSPEFSSPWSLVLGRPSTKAKFLARLQTRLIVAASTEPQVQRCSHLEAGKATMHFAGITVAFGQPIQAGNRWKEVMHISVPVRLAKLPSISALMARLTAVPVNPFYFLNSDGQSLTDMVAGGYGNLKHYQGTFFITGGKPATVVATIYRHTTVITVPFEFHHILLLR